MTSPPPAALRRRTLPKLILVALCALAPATSGAGPWRADEHNSAGWQFMTPAERVEHQRRMRSFQSYAQCRAYQAEIHAKMAERARQSGSTLHPHAQSACEQLRARGRLK